jgi:hypothetical protein
VEKGETAGCRVLVMAAPLSLLEGYFRTAEKAAFPSAPSTFPATASFSSAELNGHE